MFSRGVLDHLEKSCPEAVMVRAALENALPPEIEAVPFFRSVHLLIL